VGKDASRKREEGESEAGESRTVGASLEARIGSCGGRQYHNLAQFCTKGGEARPKKKKEKHEGTNWTAARRQLGGG